MDTTSPPVGARHAGAAAHDAPAVVPRRPVWPSRLADDFFVMVHDEGRPRLTGRLLSLGLGAALLGELALLGAIGIEDGTLFTRVMPLDAGSLAGGLFHQMQADRRRPVRDWLGYIGQSSVEDVGRRLLAIGRMERTPPTLRLPGRTDRWAPTDRGRATWPAVDMNRKVCAGTTDPYQLMLFGLTAITGLAHPSMYSVQRLLQSQAALATALAPLADHPPLPDLLAHTQTAVASAVTSRRTF
jgi:hypothetical protein